MKMIKTKSFFIMLVLITTLVLSGCSGEPTSQSQSTNQNQVVVQTLKGDHFELLQQASVKLLKDSTLETISAQEVYENFVLKGDKSYYVVDVRAAEDFAKGSIEGAVNIPYALTAKPNMVANLPKDKKVVVVCYSGHTASQTAALWQMLGYDAVPMLNGMGGWQTGAGSALPEQAYGYPVTTKVTEASSSFDLPVIKSEAATSLEELAMEQSDKYLTAAKPAVINATNLNQAINEKNDDYFLIDIRNAEDYQKGHLEGAINIPYQNIAELENLKKIPTDKKVVLIGYNGNDASQVVRLLNQFGYDSYPLFQGMRVWTSNAEINGIAPVSTEVVPEYPIDPLDYELDGGGSGSASCG